MITYALLTPGRGFVTSWATKLSHFPVSADTSNPVLFTTAEIKAECPRVPTMIGVLLWDAVDDVAFATVRVLPVTYRSLKLISKIKANVTHH